MTIARLPVGLMALPDVELMFRLGAVPATFRSRALRVRLAARAPGRRRTDATVVKLGLGNRALKSTPARASIARSRHDRRVQVEYPAS